jgi:catechol 2,3-dioxygenase-like lactoylglutathione lyase family enzyme
MYLYVNTMNIQIQNLDHVVFNVADPERSLRFYIDTLGLKGERVQAFRDGRVPFPSVRISAATIIDFFPPAYHRTQPRGNNVNHIAFTVAGTAGDIEAFLHDRGIPIQREMTGNFGAQGNGAHAFHILDPDGNMIELHAYPSA